MTDKHKQKFETEELIEGAEKITHGTEAFLEKHARTLGIVFGGLILIALGYFAYTRFYIAPKETDLMEESTRADEYFDKDSMALALNGKGYLGYAQLVKRYAGTAGGEIIAYKAGVAAYRLGKYQDALNYFKEFKTKEEVLSAVREGAIGDCYTQLGKNDEALSYYEKAIDKSKPEYIKGYYYRKAILLAMSMNQNKKALELVEKMQKEVPSENEAPDVQKLYEMLKYKANGN